MSGVAVAARGRTSSAPRLDVDLGAVADNARLLAARASGELMAVVKADGFGHGALDVARTALAHGATRLGVTGLDEAWPLLDARLGVTRAELAQPGRRRLRHCHRPGRRGRGPLPPAPGRGRRCAGRTRVHLHVDAGGPGRRRPGLA